MIHTIRSKFASIWCPSATNEFDATRLSGHVCPISRENIPKDYVLNAEEEQITYDLRYLKMWLRTTNISPVRRVPMDATRRKLGLDSIFQANNPSQHQQLWVKAFLEINKLRFSHRFDRWQKIHKVCLPLVDIDPLFRNFVTGKNDNPDSTASDFLMYFGEPDTRKNLIQRLGRGKMLMATLLLGAAVGMFTPAFPAPGCVAFISAGWYGYSDEAHGPKLSVPFLGAGLGATLGMLASASPREPLNSNAGSPIVHLNVGVWLGFALAVYLYTSARLRDRRGSPLV